MVLGHALPHSKGIVALVNEPLQKSFDQCMMGTERKNSDYITGRTPGEPERQLHVPDRPDVEGAVWR